MEDGKDITKINIHEIIDLSFLQSAQDFFAKTMNVSLQCFYENKPFTNPSNFTDFCSKYTQGSELGFKCCNECLVKWMNAVAQNNKPVIFKCYSGLENFGIPIRLKGKHIATMLGGKVLTSPPDEKHFRKIANEIGVDEDKYINATKKIRITSIEQFEAITEALNMAINSIFELAYAKYLLSKINIDYKVPKNIPIEQWLFLNCEILEKRLNDREFEVLKLIVLGKNNVEIAKELYISVHTAKSYVSSILEKFEVKDRVQVAVKAIQEGLI